MKVFPLRVTPMRATVAGLLAASLLLPAAASASPVVPSGTLVGTVTCGPGEDTHASGIVVLVEGLGLSTHTDGTGKFMLTGVPASQSFTVEALGSSDAFNMASRYNVAVQAGQTVDIGNLDLSVCPQPPRDAESDQPLPDVRDAFQ
jgi:hypothetical protein